MVFLHRYGKQLVMVKRKTMLCANVREFNMICQINGRDLISNMEDLILGSDLNLA